MTTFYFTAVLYIKIIILLLLYILYHNYNHVYIILRNIQYEYTAFENIC